MSVLLEVQKLSRYFGGLAAVNDVDLQVLESEILGLIGPNGAGKTTLFNVIDGFLPPTSGRVIFDSRDITGRKPHQVAQLGIGRTFQASTLFNKISVLDNVFTGFHMSYETRVWKRLLRTPAARNEEAVLRQEALEILEFVGLESLKDELAMNLSHGHQKMLDVCLALATKPRLLLLDEPVAGMNPSETETMMDLIRQIRERGVTIVVIEHDMKVVMSICDRIAVLNYGKKIAQGIPDEIQCNDEVIEAYLGTSEDEFDVA